MNEYYKRDLDEWGEYLEDKTIYSRQVQMLDIYRMYTFILMRDIALTDILKEMGLSCVKIYGYGETGRVFVENIRHEIEIYGIYDRNYKELNRKSNIEIKSSDLVYENDIPIIVTSARYIRNIMVELQEKGYKKENIFSLRTILMYANEKAICGDRFHAPKLNQRQFLITGASFENNGAQAMLFTAISEIRKRFDDAIIWYLPVEKADSYTEDIRRKYNMIVLTDGIWLTSKVHEIVSGLNAIVDVSGYALSSNWDSSYYVNCLKIAYVYKVPLYIMPQSYGPLMFGKKKNDKIKSLLKNAKVVYAREEEGFMALKKYYNLDNVVLSSDLVLQSKKIDIEKIFRIPPENEKFEIHTQKNVAIVPNVRNYEFGDRNQILKLYKLMIDQILNMGKNIYILAHSSDETACKEIGDMYEDERVRVILKKMDCLEYSRVVHSFEYLIVSRYHGAVHAYKENIPCLILGWSDKYTSLGRIFQQEKFVFDIRYNINFENIVSVLSELENSITEQKEIIKRNLMEIQKESCFKFLDEL